MLDGQTPPNKSCDTAALTRNLAFAQKHRINGTPTSFLVDGTRISGADFQAIERGLAAQR
jgi:thiol:disulfide interchange protein DsbC